MQQIFLKLARQARAAPLQAETKLRLDQGSDLKGIVKTKQADGRGRRWIRPSI
jgi:hypothetical protein